MPLGRPFVLGKHMDELTTLRTFAACTTVLAAALVAANITPRVTVAVLRNLHRRIHRPDGGRWSESKSSL